ncbi:MAG: methylamine utilization protein [Sphingomonas fennica]
MERLTRPRLATLLLLALCGAPAAAADLDLRLIDGANRPLADAVVTVRPAGGIPARPISFPWGTTMVQKDIAFVPHVLIVPVGATVSFPNRDRVRHHLYSFSRPARFEMKLYGREETRSYTFTKAGTVALGCNIHDRMTGFIKVVDTPFAAASDAQGRLRLTGLPAGAATMTIWHPGLRARDNEQSSVVQVARSGDVRTIALPVRSAP